MFFHILLPCMGVYRLKEAVSHHSLIIGPSLKMKYALATDWEGKG